jgi:hypothetical protein
MTEWTSFRLPAEQIGNSGGPGMVLVSLDTSHNWPCIIIDGTSVWFTPEQTIELVDALCKVRAICEDRRNNGMA